MRKLSYDYDYESDTVRFYIERCFFIDMLCCGGDAETMFIDFKMIYTAGFKDGLNKEK